MRKLTAVDVGFYVFCVAFPMTVVGLVQLMFNISFPNVQFNLVNSLVGNINDFLRHFPVLLALGIVLVFVSVIIGNVGDK